MIRQIKNKKRLRELIIRTAAGVAAVAALVIMLAIAGSRNEKKKEAQETANAAKKAEESKEEVQENEEEQIEEILAQDKYGPQLASLYEKYPELRQLLLNRSEYPDWLIEYFIGHDEAVKWVVDYPQYINVDQVEIDTKALEAVDLGNYEVRNMIPLYYQWDQRWGYASYGAGLIAPDGCGTTCLSMVATGLLDNAGLTPKVIADYSYEQGYYSEESGTGWGLMSDGASGLGLNVVEVQWSVSDIIDQLSNGRPLICSMGPGDFTEQGHFIVLCGLNEEGLILVNDPNSAVNSQKAWDVQVLLDQMKAMWAYTGP